MGQVSTKLRRADNGYMWYCPACDELHPLPDNWDFDGNLESPTFSPSFRHQWYQGSADPKKRPGDHVCHYVVTAGKVAYCGDCTHSFAGNTIEMPALPEAYQDKPSAQKPSPR